MALLQCEYLIQNHDYDRANRSLKNHEEFHRGTERTVASASVADN
jgi:hypothetical protein